MSKSIKTKIIGLRFFTIYGPWGRPDMLIMKYLIAVKKNLKFLLYNKGDHFRDFTYIDDAVNICEEIIFKKIKKNFDIFNICSSKPLHITKIIKEINEYTKKPKIIKNQEIKLMFIKLLEITKK